MKWKNTCLFCLFLLAGCSSKTTDKTTEEWTAVIYARKGRIDAHQLIIEDFGENASIFTAASPRKAKLILVQDMVGRWNEIFFKDKPNAVITFATADGEYIDTVMILGQPQLKGDALTFKTDVLEGQYQGVFNEAALFIDNFAAYCGDNPGCCQGGMPGSSIGTGKCPN